MLFNARELPWFDLKMKTYTSLNFSPAEEDCLIDEVSRYPALYDAESRDHKDVSLKLNIWKMISEKLNNKSIQDCQKKWKNIRDSYMRFRRRRRKAAISNMEDVPIPESSRYARLSFLDNVKCDRLMHTSAIEEDNSLCVTEDSTCDYHTLTGGYKRKADDLIDDSEAAQMQILNNFVNPTKPPEDEIDFFMCSLANTIKKFTPELKRKVKVDMLRMVNEYEKRNEAETTGNQLVNL
ncbi:uncharacterized protein LOC135839431 [Planococcus citri]|uniref:uncharacterized protein LOC135839431 n=1 Tax=Planococcus citri TaxID=170843 RepID=UPI0031FA1961